jgi:D-alanyl-lipoteichoic acid acyltransferase DltB (MBOAT superfamily)
MGIVVELDADEALRPLHRLTFSGWILLSLLSFSTMLLIGLWHGLTVNFVAWGAWHAAGLFVHNRFAEWAKGRPRTGLFSERLARARQLGGIVITFHFVLLGWVWFALPTPNLALRVFGLLAGVAR